MKRISKGMFFTDQDVNLYYRHGRIAAFPSNVKLQGIEVQELAVISGIVVATKTIQLYIAAVFNCFSLNFAVVLWESELSDTYCCLQMVHFYEAEQSLMSDVDGGRGKCHALGRSNEKVHLIAFNNYVALLTRQPSAIPCVAYRFG